MIEWLDRRVVSSSLLPRYKISGAFSHRLICWTSRASGKELDPQVSVIIIPYFIYHTSCNIIDWLSHVFTFDLQCNKTIFCL